MAVIDGVDAHDVFFADLCKDLAGDLVEIIMPHLAAVGMPDSLNPETSRWGSLRGGFFGWFLRMVS